MLDRENKILSVLAKNFSDKRGFSTDSMKKVLMALSLWVDKSINILDLACGSGRILVPLAKIYPKKKFIGLDLSQDMLIDLQSKIKQEKIQNIGVVKDDFNNGWIADFKKQEFDLIIFFQNIHFVENLPKFIDNLIEILDSQGRVIVASTNHQQFYDLPYCQSLEKVLKFELKRTPDEPEIIEEFEKKNFKLLSRVYVDDQRKFNKTQLEEWLDSNPFSALAYLNKKEYLMWKSNFIKKFGDKTHFLSDKMVILTFERTN